jgi:hypothetical protein
MAYEYLVIRMLKPAVVAVVAPLAMKPDDSRLFVIDREKDCSEVFVGGSARGIEGREARTEGLMSRPIVSLACWRAVAGALASVAETGMGLVAHGARI